MKILIGSLLLILFFTQCTQRGDASKLIDDSSKQNDSITLIKRKDSIGKKVDASLDNAFRRFEMDAKYYTFQLKYDVDFTPYLQISFLNKFKHKTITTLMVKMELMISDRGFGSANYIKKSIPYLSQSNFKMDFSEDELKFIGNSHDLNFDILQVTSIRFSDSSTLDTTIILNRIK